MQFIPWRNRQGLFSWTSLGGRIGLPMKEPRTWSGELFLRSKAVPEGLILSPMSFAAAEMGDMELVNAFFCGGPACEKLYIDHPFYRWEGTGFEQSNPVRDLCEACFNAYTETDKEDFKLYTREMSKELMKWCDE